jgi:hypothetical protein
MPANRLMSIEQIKQATSSQHNISISFIISIIISIILSLSTASLQISNQQSAF